VLAVCHAIEPHLADLSIDGGARWVHVGRAIAPSTTPRYQCLTIIDGVTTTGFA